MNIERRQARILAMQALCQWDVQKEESPEALHDFLATHAEDRGGIHHASKLVRAYWSCRFRIDDAINTASAKWDLARISPVDRNIMRIAIVETLENHAPMKVALDEAIEIGRAYGGEESPRFINGVLDRVMKTLFEELPPLNETP